MAKILTAFKVPEALKSINVIKFEDWLQLTVFADHAITFNATNETQLRILAKMGPNDPIPSDVKATIEIYQRLEAACKKWMDIIVPGTNEVAREVIRHRDDCEGLYKMVEDTIQAVYPKVSLADAKRLLSEQWKSGHPSAEAAAARAQIARIIGRVQAEADRRKQDATKQHDEMDHYKNELDGCNKALLAQAKDFKDHYGAESGAVTALQKKVKQINEELMPLRKKESDEVITLETAPLYLLIPWPFGAIIMAGVLSGVGADLDQVRKKIDGLVKKLTQESAELKKDQAFLGYHGWAMDATGKSAEEVTKTLPALKNVMFAWQSITSDLKDLHDRLLDSASKDALAGDFDFAKIDLESALREWQRLAGEAAGYLEHQMQQGAGTTDLDKAMRGIVVKLKPAA
jgi:hypothetical protein